MIDQISTAALCLVREALGSSKQAQRALAALEAGAVYRDWAGDVRCESSSHPGKWHLTTYDTCTCTAAKHGKTCGHEWAYRALCLWEHHVRRMTSEEIEVPLF